MSSLEVIIDYDLDTPSPRLLSHRTQKIESKSIVEFKEQNNRPLLNIVLISSAVITADFHLSDWRD